MNRFLLSSIALLACVILHSQTVWENDFGLPDSTFAIDIQETADGNFLLYGGTFNNSPEPEAFLLKFTEDGEEMWMNSYGINPSFTYLDFGNIASYPSGNLFISSSGNIIISGDQTFGLDAGGNVLWEHAFGATDIAEFSNGELLAVDHSHLRKLNADGSLNAIDSIGLERTAFLDSALLYESWGIIELQIIPAYDTYTQVEVIGDSLIVLTGMFLDDGTNFINNGPVTKVLSNSSMTAIHTNRRIYDTLGHQLPPAIGHDRLFNTSSIADISFVNMMAAIPITRYFDQCSLLEGDWAHNYTTLFLESGAENEGYDLIDASIKQVEDGFVLNTWISHFGGIFYANGAGIIHMDIDFNFTSAQEISIGDTGIPDVPHAFCPSLAGSYFISGAKDRVPVPGPPPTYTIESKLGDFFVARIGPFCSTDLNGDGTVDISDFIALNSDFGNECNGCPSDINGDGIVDIADFLEFNSTFGSNCPE